MTEPGLECLLDALENGDTATLDTHKDDIKTYVELGGLPGFLDAVGRMPAQTVEWFLDNGADPNEMPDDGFPALHLALGRAPSDRTELLHLLLKRGSDPNQRGINDWTPLHHAIGYDAPPFPILSLLLEYGADPDLRTRIDDCATPSEEAALAGRTEVCRFLENWAAPRRTSH